MRAVIFVLLAAGLAVSCQRSAAPPPDASALGACVEGRGDDGAARLSACDAALAQDGLTNAERAAALVERGELRRAGGDPTGALADYDAALAIDGALSEAQLGRAAVLISSGQLDAAEPLIVNVIRRGAPPARAHFLLGVLRARQGDAGAATASLNAAIAADDRNAEAFAARGGVKQSQGDDQGAEQDFERALALDDRNVEARAGRCWMRVRRGGDLAASLRDAEAALAVSAQNRDAQLCRGLIMLRREDWAEARASYDAVLLNDPSNAAALFGRGVARRESDERDEGRADIRRAYGFNSHIDEDFERLGVDF
jgi:tetratricopeptide (TPR) repeat protein